MLLLGGDLYDINEPSPAVHAQAIQILEKYVFGLKKPKFELQSPPDVSFGSLANCIDDIDRPNWLLGEFYLFGIEMKKIFVQNCRKEWVNIELPVLSVHGNHDNPVGEFSASAIDLLTTLGLISHFGRIHDANK